MENWFNIRFLVVTFSLLVLSSDSIKPMDENKLSRGRIAEIDAQKTCGEKFVQWSKEYGLSLALSAAICATLNQFVDNEVLKLFGTHSFGDTLTQSLKNVLKIPVQNKETLLKSIGILVSKNLSLFTTGMVIGNIEMNFFPSMHLGFWEAYVLAMFYTTASHFTNEEEHELKNNAELLEKILQDPRFAATCHELAKKTIEVVVHNPDIIAEQLNDPALQQKLAAIKANPELVEEYCRRSEAWLALQQELTMPNTVIASTSAPQPAPAVLSIPEDQAAADKETGAHGVSLESTIGERHASDGSGSRRGSSPERIHSIEQFAEMMQIFSQDPRFAELMNQMMRRDSHFPELVETGLRQRISQRATAIAAAVAQKRANEEAAILEEVLSYEVNEQQEVVRPEQPGLISRLGNWARGLRESRGSARDERSITNQSLGIVSMPTGDVEAGISAHVLETPVPLLPEKMGVESLSPSLISADASLSSYHPGSKKKPFVEKI